jgi:hypothetical protein
MPEQDNVYEEIDVSIRPNRFSKWAEHMRTRLSRRSTQALCVYDPEPAKPWYTLNHPAQRWDWDRVFGRVEDDDDEPAEESIDTGQEGSGKTREVFASYIFTTMQDAFSCLPKLTHVEPGVALQNDPGAKGDNCLFIANYGPLFATSIMLRPLPDGVSRLRIRNCPWNYDNHNRLSRFSYEATWFCVKYVAKTADALR